MANYLEVKLISSKGILYTTKNSTGILLDTKEGKVEILPSHGGIVSILKLGLLEVLSEGSSVSFTVAGGTFSVRNNIVTILVDDSHKTEELIKIEIEESIRNASEKISQTDLSPSELIQLEKQLMYERFKLGFINKSEV